ncbi:hypothetical protein SpAn4DRAFT_4284 [Sporomusa ovata]|uniref:LysR substrate-binding domain-containing protein n=1 Tax=Sporomusa ovata TaxID=2378 RepID=A0A0U1L5G8_9FIRM|nr:hypothetical protein [Sporomusa ovata]CQR74927.1 hypothetical protein SpAn4DRAFT_4284 [Sporomusa ovata]
MLLESDNITRQYINQFFIENKIFIKSEIEINTMDFLVDFAKSGLGVTVVIRRTLLPKQKSCATFSSNVG